MAKNIEQMMLDNTKLVYYFYNKLPQTELCINNKEDIISEGMIGLWKGCKTFDESKGYKLATYLSRCINNEMYMFFRKLNKQPECMSLDAVINIDTDGNELTLADTIMVEDEHISFVVDDYLSMYFSCNRMTSKSYQIITDILTKLLDGETQINIAKQLNMSRSNLSRYIAKIKQAIIKERNK